MQCELSISPIAFVRNAFPTKFGLPRQSGLVPELTGEIVFLPKYRENEAFRGLDGYSHIWLIWGFSLNEQSHSWSPTVRPPRLGGNTRMGIFATRSPNRPNPLGLSVVKLEAINHEGDDAPTLIVSGCDMACGTPIYDIKPYLPHIDSIEGAEGGFTDKTRDHSLGINIPDRLINMIPEELRGALVGALQNDPRPAYQNDPDRIYGFGFADMDVHFKVNGNELTVTDIVKI